MVSLLGMLVACSALAEPAAAQLITSDTHFYGQSPPVYPSPEGAGAGDWKDAYAKARDLVGQMTLEEKVNLTTGTQANNGCSGNIGPIPRLNFPGLCLTDGPAGVRSTNYVNSWPAQLSVGASWNRNLTRQRGIGMGTEFKIKGVNVPLGPVVGPLGRIATGGRNWEGFGNDPYHAGILVGETVQGMESVGVTSNTKHFIMNEQERNRNPEGNVSALSSNLDDKTMHELYLWPFQDAVKAGTGSIMCSYQRINNSYGCQNSATQNGLLKTELGFQGFVVTDWGALHAGYHAALAGLDMVMPSSPLWGDNLTLSVTNGSLPEARIDDMVTRVIAAWYKSGQDKDFPAPGVGMPADLAAPHERVIAKSPDSKETLLQGAIEGHVLVKNINNALPLKEPKLLSLFGYSARAFDQYNPGGPGWNSGSEPLSPSDRFGTFPTQWNLQSASNGTLLTGGGSGGNQPAYLSSAFEALSVRAHEDNTNLWWDFASTDPQVDPTSDACVVAANAFATEGSDRLGLRDDFADGLILNVAARCRNTVVVFHNAGVRLVDAFADHPNVTALVFAHVPGQDNGRALAALLYGDANPSGKLPYSVPRNESDFGPLANETRPAAGDYALFPQSDFTEGVYIDYRAFDKYNITPRYAFGFGLSYTTFAFADLAAAPSDGAAALPPYPTGPVESGGHTDLWDVVARVSARVTNTGAVAGAEVAQLYVGVPGGPVRQLRGFEKPFLEPGESATVEFALTRRDLSTWDVAAQNWRLEKGEYPVYVGSSSRDLPLTATLTL